MLDQPSASRIAEGDNTGRLRLVVDIFDPSPIEPSSFSTKNSRSEDDRVSFGDIAGFSGTVHIPSGEISGSEDERRRRESHEIESRFADYLSKRSLTKSMSPDYVKSLPTSMKEKLRVTPEEEEAILYHYATTSSLNKTASACGVSLDKVRSVVYSPSSQTPLADLRDAMRISVITKIEETQTILLDAIQTPSKLDAASLTQLASVLSEISAVQLSLRDSLSSASRAYGLLQDADPADIFSGDELEYMAFLRRRLSLPSSASREMAGSISGGESAMNGHEFIDPDFVASPSASQETKEDFSPLGEIAGVPEFIHNLMKEPE